MSGQDKPCVQCGKPVGYTGDRVRMTAKLEGSTGAWAGQLCGVCFDKEWKHNHPPDLFNDRRKS